MRSFGKVVRRFWSDETGQGTVEWVLITALVVVVIMALILIFKDEIKRLIGEATDKVSGWSVD